MKRTLGFLTVFSVLLLGSLIFDKSTASAAYCTYSCNGYFTGNYTDPGVPVTNLISSGVSNTSVASFKTSVHNALGTSGASQNNKGAAMLVDWMLGKTNGNGSFTSFSTGIAYARNNLAAWDSLVDAYGNGLHPGYGIDLSYNVNPAYNSAYNGKGGTNNDDFFHTNMDGTIQTIRFIFPGGNFYIQISCGNLVGLTGLPRPPASPQLDPAINVYGPNTAACFNTSTGLRYSGTRYGYSGGVNRYVQDPNYVIFTLPAGCNTVLFNHIIQDSGSALPYTTPWSVILNKSAGAGGTFPPWIWLRQDINLAAPISVGNHTVYSSTVTVPNGQTWCERLYIDRSSTIASKWFNPDGNRYAGVCVTVANVSASISCAIDPITTVTAPANPTITGHVTIANQTLNASNYSFDGGVTWRAPTSGAPPSLTPIYTGPMSAGSYTATLKVDGSVNSNTCTAPFTVLPSPWAVTADIDFSGVSLAPDGVTLYVPGPTSIGVIAKIQNGAVATPVLTSRIDNTASANGGVSTPTFATKIINPGLLPNKPDSWIGSFNFSGTPGYTLATAPKICFTHTVTPGNYLGAVATSVQKCVYMLATQGPIVQGTGSDVHSGANCEASSFTGITPGTTANIGSFGQYVVSSFGGISGLLSNGGANTKASSLGYTTVCRPDLFAVAQKRYPTLIAATPVVLDGMAAGVYHYGGSVTIHGVVNNKITIIANGSVTIDNNINVNGAGVYTASTVPSLGIVARDNINIRGSVTNIDAYLFAGQASSGGAITGTINTCIESTLAACGNTLNVNGFLMGNALKLNRTGLTTTPGIPNPIGENIHMTGQLYVNPPAVFDLPNTFNFLQTLGERPPLN